jgi:hypothetical protein
MPPIETGPDRGPLLLGVCWTLTSLSTVMVALRFYCRVNYQGRVWWDDFWMAVALVCSLDTFLGARADSFAVVCLGPKPHLDGVLAPRRNRVRANERAKRCHYGALELDLAVLVYGRSRVRQVGRRGVNPAAPITCEMAHDSP